MPSLVTSTIKPTVIRLIHLANHGSTNIGNGALIQGTERVVSEDFPCDIEWIPAA
jgi:hypothetical protein